MTYIVSGGALNSTHSLTHGDYNKHTTDCHRVKTNKRFNSKQRTPTKNYNLAKTFEIFKSVMQLSTESQPNKSV